ncbi:MAG: phosphatidylglycerol lysyltransferase domain-containing protein, partial [Bacteroidota bacterium]
MNSKASVRNISKHVKKFIPPVIRENRKIISQFVFTLFFIAVGIWFIKHEGTELGQVKNALVEARWEWVLMGIVVTAIHILLQGQLYVFSFAATRSSVSLIDSTVLFLKRNFISVFLPAGGISSLAFFTSTIEKKGVKKSQIHFASSVYAFNAIVSLVIVAIPAFIFAIFQGTLGSGEWYALGTVVIIIVALIMLYRSIVRKGMVYTLLIKWVPVTEVFMNDLQNKRIDKKKFVFGQLTSVVIEFTGMAHLYIAMVALNFHPSIFAAVMGYIISVIFMVVSPFMRGLGAVEVSMTYILLRFGFGNVEAIAITFLYRFFEFWMPLFSGVLAFLSKINKLLMRILPALFLMGLGILNIISVVTPAISERLIRLKDFLPVEIIHASDYLVMGAGLFLLVTAAFMLKGLRTAWWFAIVLSIVSFVGHITKAIDYEESIVALLVVFALVTTRKEYNIRTNPKLRNAGIQTSLLFTLAIFVYGIAGFYFLDKKHFNIDFSWAQSIWYTFQNYFLIQSNDLIPSDAFAKNFLYSINISGFFSIAFLIYTLVSSRKPKKSVNDEEMALAKNLLQTYGNSALDYFKTYRDKLIFISQSRNSFLSYRVSGYYAVVLENPVVKDKEEFKRIISEFDLYCYKNGLKSIYYLVPEETLELFREFKKKDMFLGQEGLVDVTAFHLEGGSRKSIRNALKKVSDLGFKASIHHPPIADGMLQKIKAVSDDWLISNQRKEIIFSQGMFLWDELKQQTIITVENTEEKIVAFLNIIPDYNKAETTYDLIRKTTDAPNGVV